MEAGKTRKNLGPPSWVNLPRNDVKSNLANETVLMGQGSRGRGTLAHGGTRGEVTTKHTDTHEKREKRSKSNCDINVFAGRTTGPRLERDGEGQRVEEEEVGQGGRRSTHASGLGRLGPPGPLLPVHVCEGVLDGLAPGVVSPSFTDVPPVAVSERV